MPTIRYARASPRPTVPRCAYVFRSPSSLTAHVSPHAPPQDLSDGAAGRVRSARFDPCSRGRGCDCGIGDCSTRTLREQPPQSRTLSVPLHANTCMSPAHRVRRTPATRPTAGSVLAACLACRRALLCGLWSVSMRMRTYTCHVIHVRRRDAQRGSRVRNPLALTWVSRGPLKNGQKTAAEPDTPSDERVTKFSSFHVRPLMTHSIRRPDFHLLTSKFRVRRRAPRVSSTVCCLIS